MSRCGVFAKDIKKKKKDNFKSHCHCIKVLSWNCDQNIREHKLNEERSSGFKASCAQFMHHFLSSLILGLMSVGVCGRASCGPARGRKQTEKEG